MLTTFCSFFHSWVWEWRFSKICNLQGGKDYLWALSSQLLMLYVLCKTDSNSWHPLVHLYIEIKTLLPAMPVLLCSRTLELLSIEMESFGPPPFMLTFVAIHTYPICLHYVHVFLYLAYSRACPLSLKHSDNIWFHHLLCHRLRY